MAKEPPNSGGAGGESKLKNGQNYWKNRLLRRRYRFPPSGESKDDWAAYIDHGGAGYFFPLGTSDEDAAAAKAARIYQMAAKQGWNAACRKFSRELIVSFEWCMNPVLWTYTTIHTLVGKEGGLGAAPAHRQRVMVVEWDAGIRRALCWSIDQQAGFASVPCDAVESFAEALARHNPGMVLVNRQLTGRLGLKSTGRLSSMEKGALVLTYSVHVDGDQMFISTPGGAEGYVAKRVRPEQLLEPILKAVKSEVDEILAPVRFYFRELLRLHSSQENMALAKLSRREREVLELLSKGCVDKEIAQAMGISAWTVHGHVKKIFERLQVHTRTEAVIRYLEK